MPCGVRIADNPAYTHDWCPPTYAWTLRNSALRTTTPPTMGVHQRVCWRGSGALVKPDSTVLRPGETQSENRSLVNFYENTPPEAPVWTPHCGQPGRHPSLVRAHELYKSTKQSLRPSIDLGKRGPDADSCTTVTRMTRPGRLLRGPGPPCGLRIADNNGPTNNGWAPRVCKTRRHHHLPFAATSINTTERDDFCKTCPREPCQGSRPLRLTLSSSPPGAYSPRRVNG